MCSLQVVETRRSWVVLFLIGAVLRAILLPRPINQPIWRECDLGGIARNYYREGMNPFYPRVDWRGDSPGYAEMEFPAYPWAMAALYHVFGVHDVIGRVLSYLAGLLALVIFFRLARVMLSLRGAFVAALIFTLSPLAVEQSTAIQPEPFMLLGMLLAVFYFLRWLSTDGLGVYFAAMAATAGAILAKVPAAHLGILFAALLLTRKGWRSLLSPLPWLFAIGALTPPLLWYSHARNFWLTYGNSLGVSNEYHWVGLDLFTDPSFLIGLVRLEMGKVWTPTGIVLGCLGAVQARSNPAARLALLWLGAALAFYLVALRTTSSGWAYYYHIASLPPAALLKGVGAEFNSWPATRQGVVKVLIAVALVGICSWDLCQLVRLVREKRLIPDDYYESRVLGPMLPESSLLLVPGGGSRGATGYPVAYNDSHLLYWLDRKGFNMPSDQVSMDNLHGYQSRGAQYFVTGKQFLDDCDPDFAARFRARYPLVAEAGAMQAYRLDPPE